MLAPVKVASFVAEKFAFEQGFGNGGATDFDEGAGAPGAQLVQRISGDFLACAKAFSP